MNIPTASNQSSTPVADLVAELHPNRTRYNVTFCGEIVVKNSRDPEHDIARALVARNIPAA